MESESIVILTLHTPKERVWGELVALTPSGITLRGIALSAFEQLLREVSTGEVGPNALSLVFYPMYRVERMNMDEGLGEIPSLAERFEQKVGLSLLDFLHAGHRL